VHIYFYIMIIICALIPTLITIFIHIYQAHEISMLYRREDKHYLIKTFRQQEIIRRGLVVEESPVDRSQQPPQAPQSYLISHISYPISIILYPSSYVLYLISHISYPTSIILYSLSFSSYTIPHTLYLIHYTS
jgi:hypothetical protein